MNKKRKNRMGKCVDCDKEIYCADIEGETFCQECAMLRNLKILIDIANGKEI